MLDTLRKIGTSAKLWRIWGRIGYQDVKLRYRRSRVGPAWIFINLGVTLAAVGFVYGKLFNLEISNFLPYITVGMVFWGYLTSSILDGGSSFLGSTGYIKQISLPLYVFVFRGFFRNLLVTSISLTIVLVVILLFNFSLISLGILWVIPGLLFWIYISWCLTAIFSHLNVRFRDSSNIASSALSILFYCTPVIYPANLLQGKGIDLFLDINPIYHLIEVVRSPLLNSSPAEQINYIGTIVFLIFLSIITVVILKHFQNKIVYYL